MSPQIIESIRIHFHFENEEIIGKRIDARLLHFQTCLCTISPIGVDYCLKGLHNVIDGPKKYMCNKYQREMSTHQGGHVCNDAKVGRVFACSCFQLILCRKFYTSGVLNELESCGNISTTKENYE